MRVCPVSALAPDREFWKTDLFQKTLALVKDGSAKGKLAALREGVAEGSSEAVYLARLEKDLAKKPSVSGEEGHAFADLYGSYLSGHFLWDDTNKPWAASFAAAWMFPHASCEMDGAMFAHCPSHGDKVLAFQYGADWATPPKKLQPNDHGEGAR